MFIKPQNPLHWLAALHLPSIGPITFRRWLKLFPNITELFAASESDLQAVGFSSKEIRILKNPDWSAAEKDLNWLEASACHLLSFQDAHYPPLLREIYAAPLLLFVKGNLELLAKPQIAMVGSRTPTVMGCETAEQFAEQLAARGLVITSGMALGIDAASHRGALTMGSTIAVMGAGLQHIYPVSHRKLAEQIITNGAWVSEFSPSLLPQPRNFPLRNRVISGLSIGVLVVEAALRSGSLITARDALEQGREVFAIPGSIHNPLARGCHYLLKQGAKLVETADDIVEELGALASLFSPVADKNIILPKTHQLDEKSAKLLAQIGFETTAVDTIIVRSGLTPSKVSSILLSLELEGYVQATPGGYVCTTQKR